MWRLCGVLAVLTAGPSVAQAPPPAWVRDAVVYQILPDRFANGDTLNDPTWASLGSPARVDSAAWAVSDWTADWYRRQPWEGLAGPGFYEDGVAFRRFGGDLQGVHDRLDHLQALGVTAVLFAPVFHAPGLGRDDAAGYVHVDPFLGPDPPGDLARLGRETADPATWGWTRADSLFLTLLAEMHARGMRVVVDGPTLAQPVRDPFFTATRRWMDPDGDGDPADGVDGWRIGAAEGVPEAFWRDWTALARSLNPEAYFVAEVRSDVTRDLPETGFASAVNHHGLTVLADGFLADGRVSADTFATGLAARFNALPLATRLGLLNVLDSHDVGRLPSRIVDGGLAESFNRGEGPRQTDRYSVRAPNAEERELQRMVVTLHMALPGPPLVTYGSEAGMWGGDPDSRKPMVWPDLTYEAETRDPLGRPRAPDPVRFDSTLFRFYQSAIALRRGDAVLRGGGLRVFASDSAAQSFAVERVLGGQRRVVALNRSGESQFLAFPQGTARTPLVPIFASTGDVADIPSLVFMMEEDGSAAVGLRLPPRTAVVFRPAEAPDVRPNGLTE